METPCRIDRAVVSPLPMYGSPRHIHGSAVSLPTTRMACCNPFHGLPSPAPTKVHIAATSGLRFDALVADHPARDQ